MTERKYTRIVRENVSLLSLCVIIQILGGQMLNANVEKLITFPIILMMVPVINSVGGNVGTVLGARLASGLHLGYIDITLKNRELQENVFTSFLLGVITYGALALTAYLVAPFLGIGRMDVLKLVTITMLSGTLLLFVLISITVAVAFASFRKGLDPDNTVIPVVTTVGDFAGIAFLMTVLWVVV